MLGDCVCDCDLRRARNSRSDPTSSRCHIAHPREHCARTAAQNFCASEPNPTGGARRDRTDDLLLAKQALSQLSYGPAFPKCRTARKMVGLGRFELPTSRLSSARSNQLSYKPLTLNPLKGSGACARGRLAPDAIAQALSPWRVFVREERETKTAKSRQWSSTIWRSLAPDVSKEVR